MYKNIREKIAQILIDYTNGNLDATYFDMAEELIEHGCTYIDPAKEISVIWHINDVKEVRPRLTDEQAMEVLEVIKKQHDADIGISWETLRIIADDMFPEEEAK